jgi:hypothetical protein
MSKFIVARYGGSQKKDLILPCDEIKETLIALIDKGKPDIENSDSVQMAEKF